MRILPLLAALLLGWLGAPPARALESAPVTSARVTATLISDVDSVAPGAPFRLALRLRIANGWHTYWKNPGDAGAPPSLDWTLPAGVTAGPVQWAAPRRIPEGPLMTYGFTGELLLPVAVTQATALAGSLNVVLDASWLVCKDICVPEEGRFTLTLPVSVTNPASQAALFAAHDRLVPRSAPWTARIAGDGTLSVQGSELSPQTVADAWFIPATAGRIRDDAAQPLTVGYGEIILALKPIDGFRAQDGLVGVLTLRDPSGQQTDVAIEAMAGVPNAAATLPLPRMLLFAFLGGLILNLMPCVFPVLAMKAVGLAAARAKGHATAHALAYTLGVLVTFAVLGGVLLAARAVGAASGWGFQFQSTLFVATMAWLLFAVGLNLSGVFQIGAGVMGAGSGLARRGGHVGSFLTGLLAVLVATPCTAPFMGVAIAAGLAAPAPVTLAVFLAMGLGLASPYMLLASLPGFERLLPRPGAWMDLFKQALAFPMYGAAVWLLWVVARQAGADAVLAVAAGAVLLGAAAWVLGLTQLRDTVARRTGQAVVALALLALGSIAVGIAPGTMTEQVTASRTEAFSADRLAALRAEGRPVFVNMTAAWCVTCLVNERVAIATDAVQAAFAAGNVAYLKGDWTRQDPAITTYLRQHGRDGVPLYVYYPPGGGPLVLPQILTPGTILEALGPPAR